MANKRVFVSFDYDYDADHQRLVSALAEHNSDAVVFDAFSPPKLNGPPAKAVRDEIARRIHDATHTLIVVGKCANKYHRDKDAIGARNWQWLEIELSEAEQKALVAVKIDPSNAMPNPLYGKHANWSKSFTVESILAAIEKA